MAQSTFLLDQSGSLLNCSTVVAQSDTVRIVDERPGLCWLIIPEGSASTEVSSFTLLFNGFSMATNLVSIYRYGIPGCLEVNPLATCMSDPTAAEAMAPLLLYQFSGSAPPRLSLELDAPGPVIFVYYHAAGPGVTSELGNFSLAYTAGDRVTVPSLSLLYGLIFALVIPMAFLGASELCRGAQLEGRNKVRRARYSVQLFCLGTLIGVTILVMYTFNA
eukprot:CAMPEP_0170745884 /NCGR_PEP_ID=MMETSP0437-20130122/8520_1 /TAXON_ID=0 /ORGANISM="Sexangularia sp." /LENGTH=218 /DNA_ID=CAMNT_0011084611 /DNA_START=83 /DNA_END=739 /DNA_ORIENTATION=-